LLDVRGAKKKEGRWRQQIKDSEAKTGVHTWRRGEKKKVLCPKLQKGKKKNGREVTGLPKPKEKRGSWAIVFRKEGSLAPKKGKEKKKPAPGSKTIRHRRYVDPERELDPKQSGAGKKGKGNHPRKKGSILCRDWGFFSGKKKKRRGMGRGDGITLRPRKKRKLRQRKKGGQSDDRKKAGEEK